MKNRLTIIFPAVLLSLCLASCKSQEGQETPVSDITADPQSASYSIDPAFFGVCDMFWKESDEYMADGVIENYLKEMQCGFLRFPGGTESDNFDWRTNTLVDKRRWPNEDGQDKLTTDKFISLCRRIGAEPIICVNTEIAIFESEQTAIELAADWVEYCNIEKGYDVKYWEIGNEPYYHYRFTAETYAALVRKETGREARVSHFVVSPPQEMMKLAMQTYDSYDGVVRYIESQLIECGGIGGDMVFHPWRQRGDRWELSPHFHCLLFGYIDTRRFLRRNPGWIIKKIHAKERIKSIRHTMGYLQTHCGLARVEVNPDDICWRGCRSGRRIQRD